MQLEIIQATDLARAEARMLRWMVALAPVGTLITLIAASPRAAIGFLIGALFGILNYLWLHQTIVVLMNAGKARVPKATMVKMLVRYPVSLAGIFLFYETGSLPILALVCGLLVPGGGVLIECLFLIGAGFRQHEVVG